MQLTEIKNDLATINYNPEINRLMLSDFVLIEDSNQSILAQVISIEATMEDDVNSAMLKFLLSIDKDANLTQYTGYVPARSATLILINPREVVQLIKGNDKNLYFGNLAAYNDIPVELNMDFLRKRPYIQVDFAESKSQVVETVVNGLKNYNKKTVLFDFCGSYKDISLPALALGQNFKLPLNYEALCYIAEEELDDCNNDNKAIIQGILIEVQNYVKTTAEKFIPFDTLISVLDAQYEESPLPELLLLKNKLLKYQQQGIFAQDKSEFDFIDTFLKDTRNFKFDLSELPLHWHRIAFVSILDLIKSKCYIVTEFTDENSNKSVIKKLYEKTDIRPIVISSYQYKYQLQLKALSKNLILFKPVQKTNDFAGYTSFLNILNQDTFIVWGEHTLFIPLILRQQTVFKTAQTILPAQQTVEANIEQMSQQPTVEPTVADISNIEQALNSQDIEEEQSAIEETFIEEPVNEKVIEQENFAEQSVQEDTTFEINPQNVEATEQEIIESVEPTEQEEIIAQEMIENAQPIEQEETLMQIEPETIESDMVAEVEPETEPIVSESAIEEPAFEQIIQEQVEEPVEQVIKPTIEQNEVIEEEILQDNNIENVQDTEITQEEPELAQEVEDVPNGDDLDFFFNEDSSIEPTENINYVAQVDTEVGANEDTERVETAISETNIQEPIKAQEESLDADDMEVEEEPIENLGDINLDENLEEIITDEADEPIDTQPDEEVPLTDENEEVELPQAEPELKSPAIPIYSSTVAPQIDVKFAQGTYVQHPTYGRGIVEKVINYGSKNLCSIVFDNVGRRLLDPNITKLEQV